MDTEYDLDQPTIYQIKVKGRLDESWSLWFDGLDISPESSEAGPTVTIISGPIPDQAALHGILIRIRDLGLPLLAVNMIEPDEIDQMQDKT